MVGETVRLEKGKLFVTHVPPLLCWLRKNLHFTKGPNNAKLLSVSIPGSHGGLGWAEVLTGKVRRYKI